MTTQTFSTGLNPSIKIENIEGDLSVTGWDRSEVEARGDEIRHEQSGDPLSFSSAGDLNLSAPRGSAIALSYVDGDVKIENLDGAITVSFVGGDVLLRNLSGQVEMAGAIGGDVQMENVGRISMGARKGGLDADLSARIRNKVDEATRRAERKMRDAEQKIRRAEIKIQNAGRKARDGEHRARVNVDTGRWKWNMTPGSVPPGGISEPVSDEERMAILKMLQEKKITSEEAEKLLTALEGGS